MLNESLKYLIYSRKSSEDEDRQVLSIDGQLSEMNRIAVENSATVIDTLTESRSAKGPGREVFNELLQRIENGEANAILTWKLDRLARNFDDGGRIIGMLQRGTIREIRTFEKTYLPSDNVLMIAVEFGMANQYVRDLSVNVRRGIREKIRRGVFHGKAPAGYLNDPRLRTIEPHPQNFKKVKRILNLVATGRYSLTQAQSEFTAAGILGRSNMNPIALSAIAKLLKNPFYCGVFLHKGEMHEGIHVPMISKQTYDNIQDALIANGKPRKQKHDKGFLFRNFATCGSCGHAITAERQIKNSGLRLDYYHCTHRSTKQRCSSRRFTRAELFASEVKRNIELVYIPDEWKERFLARVTTLEAESSQEALKIIDRLRAALLSVKSKINRLNDGFAGGTIEIDEFKEMKNPLTVRKLEIEEKITNLQKSPRKRFEPLKAWILTANSTKNLVSALNWVEMKSFLKTVGSNRRLTDQTLTVSFKKPWNLLAKTVAALQSVSEVSKRYSLWWNLFEDARTIFEENSTQFFVQAQAAADGSRTIRPARITSGHAGNRTVRIPTSQGAPERN